MAQPTRLQRRFKSHDQGPKGWYREKLLGAFADFEGDGTEAGGLKSGEEQQRAELPPPPGTVAADYAAAPDLLRLPPK